MLIKISDYAAMHGKSVSAIKKHIYRGRIPSTIINGTHYIDSETPYPDDKRIKNGKYVGIREIIKKRNKSE